MSQSTNSWAFTVATVFATALVVDSLNKYYFQGSILDTLSGLLKNIQTSEPISKSSTTGTSTRTGNKLERTSENSIVYRGLTEYPEELIKEQLARNYAFLTDEGMEKIRQLKVIVIGAGGVGSNAIVSLVRSGVSQMRIVDFDQVSLSSLNRHACATLKDVGRSKVDVLAEFVSEICPWIKVEGINELFSGEKSDRLLTWWDGSKPDFVIDCIDNIDTKIELLEYCYNHQIECVSSMGAACKSDSTRVNIGDISVSDEDPLARTVRRKLKKMGIMRGITTVFSAEKPDPRKVNLLPLPDDEFEKGPVDELTALRNFRVRILPVLGPMPAIFGLAISTHVITTAGGYPVEPIEGKNRYKVYDSLFNSLAGQQTRVGIMDQKTPFVGLNDMQYILEEVWRGKSPISGLSSRLSISRWDMKRELGMDNVILLTKDETKEHERRCLKGGEDPIDVYGPEVMARINKRFEEEKYYSQFR